MKQASSNRIHNVSLIAVMVLSASPILMAYIAGAAPPSKNGSSATTTQNWDTVLPADQRFTVLGTFNSMAVRDNETGLVWEQSPSVTPAADWVQANANCVNKAIANRKGWRLPSIVELATLIDMSQSNPALPTGHPFSVPGLSFWSATTYEPDRNIAWGLYLADGSISVVLFKNGTGGFAWCVRGQMNADKY